jgi:hypothetical protein
MSQFHLYEPYELRVDLLGGQIILKDLWGQVWVGETRIMPLYNPHPQTLDLADKIQSDFATWYEYYESEQKRLHHEQIQADILSNVYGRLG